MKHFLFVGIICSLLYISLAGVCLAESPPSSIIYVQGGGSTITDGLNGTNVVIIKDIVPYYHLKTGNISYLMPIQNLSYYSYPSQAAMILSGDGVEHITMVTVGNLSLSDENTTLTLQADPLNYYEGLGLKTYASESEDLIKEKGIEVQGTGLYIEIIGNTLENEYVMPECMRNCLNDGNHWTWCRDYCDGGEWP